MTGGAERSGDGAPSCAERGCGRAGDFWWYDRDAESWSAVCDVHARHLHPSIEVRAWMESGYMRPVELGRPDGPPPEPASARGRAFREEVDALLRRSG